MAYTKTTWVNNTAPSINAENLNKIEDGIYNSVRYADEQNLTLAQKKQALSNINAVSYNSTLLTADDDLNNICIAGWYHWFDPAPANAPYTYGLMRVDAGYANAPNRYALQTVRQPDGTRIMQRGTTDNGLTPWEYITPPMVAGVEYRTTKRINEKPVFTKKISFNGLDTSGNKAIFLGTDEAKAAWIVSAVAIDPDDTTSEGNFISIPHHNDITIGILGRWISIKWTGDYSKYTDGTIVVEYVKEAI